MSADAAPDAGRLDWRPRWPKYIPRPGRTPPPRCLALMARDGWVYPEPGVGFAARRVRSWAELSELLYEWDAALWTVGPVVDILGPDMVSDILDQPRPARDAHTAWRDRCAALAARAGFWHGPAMLAVLCRFAPDLQWCEPWLHREEPALIGLGVHRGSRIRWVATLDAWGFEPAHTETQRAHVFRSLRALFDLMGAGVRPTPGGLGEASMVLWWASDHPEPEADPESDAPPPMPSARNGDGRRWFPPARRCSHVLTHYGVGGRVDAYQTGQAFRNAVEIDAKNAYASFVGRVPCGPPHVYGAASAAHWLLPAAAPRERSATWFALVAVRILRDMPPSDPLPIAYRRPTPEDTKALEWPTRAGLYSCWLWREQVEHLERRIAEGAPIEIVGIEEAWVWRSWSRQLAPWAAHMDALRRAASGDHELQRLIKGCIVAGIGHLAMPYESRALVTADAADPATDTPWQPPSMPECTLYARPVERRAANPQAWAMYCWMRCDLLIVETAHREYRDRNNPALYASTDCLGFAREPAPGTWSADPQMGEYGRVDYPVLYLHGPGVMFAPNKVRSPGVQKAVSRQLLRRTGENARNGGRKRERGPDKAELKLQRWLELARWYAEKHYPRIPGWANRGQAPPAYPTNTGDVVVYAGDTERGW